MKKKVNVITAGPSAGKSSTIRALSARGYTTLPEAARLYLDQRISEGDDPEAVRLEDDFHERVEALDRQIEAQIPDGEVVFLDRALADNIAYRRHFGNDDDPVMGDLIEECEQRYDSIFLLERLEFTDDEVRSEDEQEAQQIHRRIRTAYSDLGYDPVDVPLMPLDDRVQFIEDHIEHQQPIH